MEFSHHVITKLPGGVFSDITQDALEEQRLWLENMKVGVWEYESYFCREPGQITLDSVNSAMYVVYCFERPDAAALFKLAFG